MKKYGLTFIISIIVMLLLITACDGPGPETVVDPVTGIEEVIEVPDYTTNLGNTNWGEVFRVEDPEYNVVCWGIRVGNDGGVELECFTLDELNEGEW